MLEKPGFSFNPKPNQNLHQLNKRVCKIKITWLHFFKIIQKEVISITLHHFIFIENQNYKLSGLSRVVVWENTTSSMSRRKIWAKFTRYMTIKKCLDVLSVWEILCYRHSYKPGYQQLIINDSLKKTVTIIKWYIFIWHWNTRPPLYMLKFPKKRLYICKITSHFFRAICHFFIIKY